MMSEPPNTCLMAPRSAVTVAIMPGLASSSLRCGKKGPSRICVCGDKKSGFLTLAPAHLEEEDSALHCNQCGAVATLRSRCEAITKESSTRRP